MIQKSRPLKIKMYLPELLQSPHISYLFDLIRDIFNLREDTFNNKNKQNILLEKKN